MPKIYTAIGLMSGTSMDGIDAALIRTDGRSLVHREASLSTNYDPDTRERLLAAAASFKGATDRHARPGSSTEVERDLTDRHAQLVADLCRNAGLSPSDVDVVGFHGQTVLHRPEIGLTIQLGDGPRLAHLCGIDVVFDLRAADMEAGGQGAPLVPVYHAALAAELVLPRPVAFVNIGGVANITWIPAAGEPVAFDTGPGNSLIDDWCAQRIGKPLDRDGQLARSGTVDEKILEHLCSNKYFRALPPKSLDRGDFSAVALEHLSAADGAATLAAFTAATIAGSANLCSGSPATWVICGGGRHNTAILDQLRVRVPGEVLTCEEVGLGGDHIEAEAFAYLAVRSLEGLPITFPGTTGVGQPRPGGRLARFDQAA